METHPLTAKNWLYVALAALVIGFLFVAPFLGVIALAALLAFLFQGFYQRFLNTFRPGTAATLTFMVAFAVVVIPVILVGIFTVFQLGQLAAVITAAFGGNISSLPEFVQQIIASVNSLAAPLLGQENVINSQGVLEFLRNTVPGVIGAVTGFIASLLGGIPYAIILFLMFIFLFFEFLLYGKKITESVVALSPFQPEVTRMYLARVGMMAEAMTKGQLVMSVIIATLASLTLSFFFNLWDYFFLMTVVFSFFNLIPLGAGIVVYPIIIIAMLTGAVWPGIAALVIVTAVSNLESFMRPKFIPKSITLTNGLTMLAAFGGIALYGLIGVIYGPIIMIIIVTSIQMYLDYYKEFPAWKKKATTPALKLQK